MTGPERRAVSVLAGVFSVRMLGLFLLLPVVALYADRLPGATPTLIGLAVGAYGITQALLQVPFGLLSDRIGRKPVIVAGLILFAAGSLLAAASDSALELVAGRALQGAGAVSAAITALLADLTRVEVRTRAMAILGVTIGGSFVLSLALGPLLADWVGIPGLFGITAGLAVVAALAILFAVPRSAPDSEAAIQPVTSMKALQGALGDAQLLRLDLGIFILHMVLTASFVAVPFALAQATDSTRLVSHSAYYVGAIAVSVVPTVALILGSERSRRPQALTGLAILLLMLAELLLIGAGNSGWGLFIGLTVFFSGFNFLEARLPARLTELAKPEMRGGALGVYATCQFLGAFAGGLLGGWLMGIAGPAGVYAMAGGAALLWWLVALKPAGAAAHTA